MPPDEIRARINTSKRSRYPVIDGSLDHVVGVLHIKDFIRAQQRGGLLTLRSLVRPMPTMAATSTAEQALARFRRELSHAALVVDEHGSTLGLITLDDIIAEVMDDEVRSSDSLPIRNDDGSVSLDGEVTLGAGSQDHAGPRPAERVVASGSRSETRFAAMARPKRGRRSR